MWAESGAGGKHFSLIISDAHHIESVHGCKGFFMRHEQEKCRVWFIVEQLELRQHLSVSMQFIFGGVEKDLDGDGEVNEDEFFRIMKKTCLY